MGSFLRFQSPLVSGLVFGQIQVLALRPPSWQHQTRARQRLRCLSRVLRGQTVLLREGWKWISGQAYSQPGLTLAARTSALEPAAAARSSRIPWLSTSPSLQRLQRPARPSPHPAMQATMYEGGRVTALRARACPNQELSRHGST